MSYTGTALATVVVVVGSTEAARLTTNKPLTVSPVVAGFALGLFLFTAGMVNENAASKLCILIILGALVKNGVPLFKLLGK